MTSKPVGALSYCTYAVTKFTKIHIHISKTLIRMHQYKQSPSGVNLLAQIEEMVDCAFSTSRGPRHYQSPHSDLESPACFELTLKYPFHMDPTKWVEPGLTRSDDKKSGLNPGSTRVALLSSTLLIIPFSHGLHLTRVQPRFNPG